VIHELTFADRELKMRIIVMPAWIAGIHARKDASGDIHVTLDSSTPCWNDPVERFYLELTEPLSVFFKGVREENILLGFDTVRCLILVFFATSFVV
jgi:hypothetical protein